MFGLGLLAAVALGAVIYAWQLQHKGSAKLHLPVKWPLVSRGLVNSTEEKVWIWLREIFHDHMVMVKTPVLRFTILVNKERGNASAKVKAKTKADNERWLERLNGVYTTFTVCTVDGKVVGCVDVSGKIPLTKASRELKETLLSDCGIGYTVVAHSSLPAGSAMRAAFLGEIPIEFVQGKPTTRGADTNFNSELQAFTIQQIKETKTAALKNLNKSF